MTLLSLFDGSGGFPLAGAINGFTPIAASEVEPYPIAVTRSRFPGTLHLGDVSKINGAEIPPVDVVTFGSPCQDLSIAGARKGLDGNRSGLFTKAIRIIREMRQATNGRYPTFVIWENVPGAFSSKEGEDFRTVLEELCALSDNTIHIPRPPKKWPHAGEIVGDGYSLAWRQFDAQYWGVPQRRKRIHIVLCLRGRSASQILFDPESLPWHSEPRQAEGQGTSGATQGGVRIPNRALYGDCGIDESTVGCASFSGQRGITASIEYAEERSPCLNANQVPDVLCAGFIGKAGASAGGIGYTMEGSPTLKAEQPTHVLLFENHGNDSRITGPVEVSPLMSSHFGTGGNNTPLVMGIKSFGEYQETQSAKTLLSSDDVTTGDLIVSGIDCRNGTESPVCSTLQAGSNGTGINSIHPVRISRCVRRLTPLECCRLQGFPDGWAIPDRKDDFTLEELAFWQNVRDTYADINEQKRRQYKKAAMLRWYNKLHTDSTEYKMWGNGIALPVAVYILRGVRKALNGEYEQSEGLT